MCNTPSQKDKGQEKQKKDREIRGYVAKMKGGVLIYDGCKHTPTAENKMDKDSKEPR